MPNQINRPNACGAKVNLKLLQEAGKAYEKKGPPSRGKVSKKKDD